MEPARNWDDFPLHFRNVKFEIKCYSTGLNLMHLGKEKDYEVRLWKKNYEHPETQPEI